MHPEADPVYELRITDRAWERCFRTICVLSERFNQPLCEFGMLGLCVPEIDSRLVIATPLLIEQHVDTASVLQSGHNVLRMRGEIAELAGQLGVRLAPSTWLHRHPGSCEMSEIDDTFLRGVFAEEIATVLTFANPQRTSGPESPCRCGSTKLARTYGLCFGVIFNADREHSIHAVRTDACDDCGLDRTRYVAASLRVETEPAWAAKSYGDDLEVEVAEKVYFRNGLVTHPERTP